MLSFALQHSVHRLTITVGWERGLPYYLLKKSHTTDWPVGHVGITFEPESCSLNLARWIADIFNLTSFDPLDIY